MKIGRIDILDIECDNCGTRHDHKVKACPRCGQSSKDWNNYGRGMAGTVIWKVSTQPESEADKPL